MKAPEPDIIFVEKDCNGRMSMPYWSTDRYLGHFAKVEYIRKDAMLEWAKHMNKLYPAGAFQMMIDKLNSL